MMKTQKYEDYAYYFADFLAQHGERRVTKDALAYYRNQGPCVAFLAFDDGDLVGVSARALTPPYHGVTVVRKDHRNMGIGAHLLAEKLAGVPHEYRTMVADDNAPSKRICEKNALAIRGKRQRVRASGEYTALEFGVPLTREAWYEVFDPCDGLPIVAFKSERAAWWAATLFTLFTLGRVYDYQVEGEGWVLTDRGEETLGTPA